MRVAGYDAATSKLSSWTPDSSANVPDQWGLIATFSMDPIPEGFAIAIIAILSTIATVGTIALRRSKTGSFAKPVLQ